ncbi:Ig-like domain-containing protein [Brevibacillus sp. SYSU BS000544]|uniref:Ig-like domain-containing protein n=1 Tax=Brevibacillus sp. SYSU BS000544 TaxID=3416443 RepID=UPI003CE57FA3
MKRNFLLFLMMFVLMLQITFNSSTSLVSANEDVRYMKGIEIVIKKDYEGILTLLTGEEHEVSVIATYLNGETKDITDKVEWWNSKKRVEVIGNKIVAKEEGMTDITAFYGLPDLGFTDSEHLKIVKKPTINPYENKNRELLYEMQDEAINYINNIKKEMGFNKESYFQKNEKLNMAAQAHSNYLQMNQTSGHHEEKTKEGYTGESAYDRVQAFGGHSFSGEGISFSHGGITEGIDNLIDAPFHRDPLISGTNEVGIGFNPGTYGSTVVDYAYKHFENYKPKFQYIVYPYPNQRNAKSKWFVAESPNPLEYYGIDGIEVGYPISVWVSNTYTLKNIKAVLKEKKRNKEKDIPFYLVDSITSKYQDQDRFFIIPKRPLQESTLYQVKFSADQITDPEGKNKKKINYEWSFTTEASVNSISIKNEEIKLKVNEPKTVKVVANLTDGTKKTISPFATYSIQDKEIVRVFGDRLIGQKKGTTKLSVYYDGQWTSTQIQVEEEKIQRLEFSKKKIAIKKGESAQLILYAVLEDNSKKDITKESEFVTLNPKICRIDKDSVVSLSKGSTKIKGKYKDFQVSINISVK